MTSMQINTVCKTNVVEQIIKYAQNDKNISHFCSISVWAEGCHDVILQGNYYYPSAQELVERERALC